MSAAEVLAELKRQGETLAVAESLTGGLLTSALVDVAGASAVVRGGVIAYATDVKAQLLGVDRHLLERVGAVHPDVALAMAEGARSRLGAGWGLATTGVAGPDPQDGQPVGTVHVACVGPNGRRTESEMLSGSRAEIRQASVSLALDLLLACSREFAG
jgi:nicotinamide-nucleotide amidase